MRNIIECNFITTKLAMHLFNLPVNVHHNSNRIKATAQNNLYSCNWSAYVTDTFNFNITINSEIKVYRVAKYQPTFSTKSTKNKP